MIKLFSLYKKPLKSRAKINYDYQLAWATLISNRIPNAKILDYGCGSGYVVKKGRKRGINIFGVDAFYRPDNRTRELILKNSNLKEGVIKEIKNNKIDFNNNFFDFIMSNQVFEHIEDINLPLKEINRVLKSDGYFLCRFPSKEVLYEGHIGIPIIHKFSKNSSTRFWYALLMRNLGFGFFDKCCQKKEWVEKSINFLDQYTFYIPKEKIEKAFMKYFKIRFIEHHLINYTLKSIGEERYIKLLNKPYFSKLAQILYQKLFGLVIIAKKFH